MIFDSHAHFDDEKFDADRYELLEKLGKNGVCCIVNAGVDIESSEKSLQLARDFPFIKSAVGIHPQEADKAFEGYIDTVKSLADDKNAVAIGEIGLDYYYDFIPRDVQLRVFEEQLMLANELNMPVVVHDREAHKDTLDLLKKHKPKGVLHCFSGSVEMLSEIMKLGMYISLGGAVTFKNAKNPVKVAYGVPISRLLLETDAPYMTPVPYRGKRCDSSHIMYTAQKIAEIKGMQTDELLKATTQNGCELFGIKL